MSHFQDVSPPNLHFSAERVGRTIGDLTMHKVGEMNQGWGSGRNIFVGEEEFRCEGVKKGWSFSFIHGVSRSEKVRTPEQS